MSVTKSKKEEKNRYFVADFETTVYKGQINTEVWAAAIVPLGSEDVQIFHSIGGLYEFLVNYNYNVIVYFHNLKFDGAFWISYLLHDLKYKQAVIELSDKPYDIKFEEVKRMEKCSFRYSISDRGMWYTIDIKTPKGKLVELRDSLKLLPFGVKKIGKGFATKHKKLDMEYEGFRYPGCVITEEEQKYIANDVLVVKEALEIMFQEGHNKLTIGACCLSEFKKIYSYGFCPIKYEDMFPNIYELKIDKEIYGSENAGEYVRRSYKGGWCYLVKGKSNQIKRNGTTADVNSLYPSMMSSESGNWYPYGLPTFWTGEIPTICNQENVYWFVRIRCHFYIKPGKLPFIQIKGTLHYDGTEALEMSDVQNPKTKEWVRHKVELTLTMTDYKLFMAHYDVDELEILDGCYFRSTIGIFDDYINKYKEIKLKSTGAMRELAKLFLNNLYGKFASSTDSSFKYAYEKDDHSIGFVNISENDKKPGYIPVGSAITSYARNFTIRAAQQNYHGVKKPGFIYADTDSIHCDLPPEKIKGITVHDKNFCCWKLESCWDVAYFTRQKTYIEHVVKENLQPVEKPYNNIKCAGMPDRCKDLFELSMKGNADIRGRWDEGKQEYKPWSPEEIDFLFDDNEKPIVRTYEDFKVGLTVPGKLLPKRIMGGVLLVETTYKMR